MSGMHHLTGWDKLYLQYTVGISVRCLIEHYDEIEHIAKRLCSGDIGTAIEDIFDKGLLELQKICEMDEEVCRDAA